MVCHGVRDFLDFLKLLNRSYPRRELHLIVDNYHTHKNVLVKEWLGRHPRFHVHFTPTSSSWLNQVEGWISLLSRRAIRRGIFRAWASSSRRFRSSSLPGIASGIRSSG